MASASTDAAEIRRRGRQRLIGAIAIVLLLVVFVPMLLDSEPRKTANDPPLDIPSKENAPPLPAPVPASAATKSEQAVAPAKESVAPSKEALVAPAKDAVAPAKDAVAPAKDAVAPAKDAVAPAKDAVAPAKDAVAPAKDAVAPAKAGAQSPAGIQAPANAAVTPAASATAPRLEGFAVQVGAFRDEAKLKHARDKLAAAGIPHYTERLDTASGGALTRLRAGPFPTRQAADGAAAKLKAAELPAQVVPLP